MAVQNRSKDVQSSDLGSHGVRPLFGVRRFESFLSNYYARSQPNVQERQRDQNPKIWAHLVSLA